MFSIFADRLCSQTSSQTDNRELADKHTESAKIYLYRYKLVCELNLLVCDLNLPVCDLNLPVYEFVCELVCDLNLPVCELVCDLNLHVCASLSAT